MADLKTLQTEAGRTLYEVAEHMEWTNGAPVGNRYMLDAILAIEAEVGSAGRARAPGICHVCLAAEPDGEGT